MVGISSTQGCMFVGSWFKQASESIKMAIKHTGNFSHSWSLATWDLIAEQISNRSTNKCLSMFQNPSNSKLLFPETSLIPGMFLNIIPNLSVMSWLTARSPSGQRGGCSSMSSTATLLLYLNDRPSCELKTLNCFWRSKGQSPNSGRIGSFGL